MAISTVGIKLDEAIRERLKAAAAAQGETPHRAMKRMIVAGLERLERGEALQAQAAPPVVPFLDFAQDVQPQTVARAAVTAAYRRPEADCLPALLAAAELDAAQAVQAEKTATNLVVKLRSKRSRGLVETLLREYALSSQEGVALM